MCRDYTENLLIIYDIKLKKFSYPVQINEYFDAKFESDSSFFSVLKEKKLISKPVFSLMESKFKEIAETDGESVYYTKCQILSSFELEKWYNIGIVKSDNKKVQIIITDINDEVEYKHHLEQLVEYDDLTGLYTRRKFTQTVNTIILEDKKETISGKYAVIYFDVQRFKAINDLFTKAGGDMLLIHIAESINKLLDKHGFACRIEADRFAIFIKLSGLRLKSFLDNLMEEIRSFNIIFDIECNFGVYVIKEHVAASVMIDRAILAQKTIKGKYQKTYLYYDDSLRTELITEQEVSGSMKKALENNQFVPYFQPQYDHGTGMLIGAEALARWNHPEKGIISPAVFVPIFEANGFIYSLDMYIFEYICKFIRKCIDNNIHVVPISTNFSRYDIFQEDFVEKLEVIRSRYSVPVKKIRIEITESAAAGGSSFTNKIVKKLHKYGYVVEMDDFGSGYSSLNVLKDIGFDIIKLDMKFLSNRAGNKRGGIILTSIVNMAKWLKMPVIAEGVEELNQADYLRSIGCNYIQGYLYSKPLNEEKFFSLLEGKPVGVADSQLEFISSFDSFDFWSPSSQETLIFNQFVGPSIILSSHGEKIEIVRVNRKYLREMGMNQSESEIVKEDFLKYFDKENRILFTDTLKKAARTKQEQQCEAWCTINSECCGKEKLYISYTILLIGKSKDSNLFFISLRNITNEKKVTLKYIETEKRFKAASEQANIYYWEYNILTKQMFPCFRCMRDLGLPMVVENYPEPAIDMGIIPADYADEYRNIHKRLEQGEKNIEIEIPLTVGRTPFIVRYTTEFDDSGRPVKAFGSATYKPTSKKL